MVHCVLYSILQYFISHTVLLTTWTCFFFACKCKSVRIQYITGRNLEYFHHLDNSCSLWQKFWNAFQVFICKYFKAFQKENNNNFAKNNRPTSCLCYVTNINIMLYARVQFITCSDHIFRMSSNFFYS